MPSVPVPRRASASRLRVYRYGPLAGFQTSGLRETNALRLRRLLAEARRRLAREMRGRRAEPGWDDRITDAAIGAYCVDVAPFRPPGRRPRPPGHTIYTAAWHPAQPTRRGGLRAAGTPSLS